VHSGDAAAAGQCHLLTRACWNGSGNGTAAAPLEFQELPLCASVIPFECKEKLMSASHDSEDRIIVSTREAREGVTGHNVRYVLGIGLVAIIVAFAVIYAAYFA
jgi:hypothetical protein